MPTSSSSGRVADQLLLDQRGACPFEAPAIKPGLLAEELVPDPVLAGVPAERRPHDRDPEPQLLETEVGFEQTVVEGVVVAAHDLRPTSRRTTALRAARGSASGNGGSSEL